MRLFCCPEFIPASYSAPGSRIPGMEIQVLRNEKSSQTNAYPHYSTELFLFRTDPKRTRPKTLCKPAILSGEGVVVSKRLHGAKKIGS